tara:strand:- start:183 stop:911 length:729 start_codon:yes stop_codon:yes gene_type:complete
MISDPLPPPPLARLELPPLLDFFFTPEVEFNFTVCRPAPSRSASLLLLSSLLFSFLLRFLSFFSRRRRSLSSFDLFSESNFNFFCANGASSSLSEESTGRPLFVAAAATFEFFAICGTIIGRDCTGRTTSGTIGFDFGITTPPPEDGAFGAEDETGGGAFFACSTAFALCANGTSSSLELESARGRLGMINPEPPLVFDAGGGAVTPAGFGPTAVAVPGGGADFFSITGAVVVVEGALAPFE